MSCVQPVRGIGSHCQLTLPFSCSGHAQEPSSVPDAYVPPHTVPLFSCSWLTHLERGPIQGPRTDCYRRLQSRAGKDPRRVAKSERGVTAFSFPHGGVPVQSERLHVGNDIEVGALTARRRGRVARALEGFARNRGECGHSRCVRNSALFHHSRVSRLGSLTDAALMRMHSRRSERQSPHTLAALADEATTDCPRPRAARETESAQEGP